jgi:DNA-binding NtrC family response regulator
MNVFLKYEWPGNVRELKNVVQRILFTSELKITPQQAKRAIGIFDDLKPFNEQVFGDLFNADKILPLKDMERSLRERYFKFVRTNSNSDTEAANKLGLAPPNYFRMCKELGLK